ARHDEQWKVSEKTIVLNDIVKQSVRSFQTAFHREIQLIAEADVKVTTDEQKLKQLLYIFLDNANKYSDKLITVKITIKDGEGMIAIIDQGVGIPEEELDNVFDRFY